jgi:hypothetical protein
MEDRKGPSQIGNKKAVIFGKLRSGANHTNIFQCIKWRTVGRTYLLASASVSTLTFVISFFVSGCQYSFLSYALLIGIVIGPSVIFLLIMTWLLITFSSYFTLGAVAVISASAIGHFVRGWGLAFSPTIKQGGLLLLSVMVGIAILRVVLRFLTIPLLFYFLREEKCEWLRNKIWRNS